MLLSSIEITNYYAAINELAAMLQDRDINVIDWRIQHAIMYHAWHEL